MKWSVISITAVFVISGSEKWFPEAPVSTQVYKMSISEAKKTLALRGGSEIFAYIRIPQVSTVSWAPPLQLPSQ